MIKELTVVWRGANPTGAVSGLAHVPIIENGTLTGVQVLSKDPISGGAASLTVSKNGVNVSDLAMLMTNGSDNVSSNPVSIAVVKGDDIVLNLTANTLISPVTFTVFVDDGETVGSGSAGIFNPDANSASPHALDDDFSGNALNAKWNSFGAADMTLAVADSLLRIKQTSQATFKLSGIYQTMPSGNFSAIAKINFKSGNVLNYAECGICLLETDGATGNIHLFSSYTTAATLRFIQDSRWTNRTTFNANRYAAAVQITDSIQVNRNRTIYLRVEKSGTAYLAYWSFDGINWILHGASNTIAFTPTKIGLCMYNQGTGADVIMLVDFFRIFAAMPDAIGGEI